MLSSEEETKKTMESKYNKETISEEKGVKEKWGVDIGGEFEEIEETLSDHSDEE